MVEGSSFHAALSFFMLIPRSNAAAHNGMSQWVHVAIWYVSGPSRSSYVVTSWPLYVLYKYVDPLGVYESVTLRALEP